MSGSNDLAVKHKVEHKPLCDSNPVELGERKYDDESQLKSKLKTETKTELKMETGVVSTSEMATTSIIDVGPCGKVYRKSRSRSSSGDGNTNSASRLKRESGGTDQPLCREDDEKEETIPASKKTKLNNGEAVRKEENTVIENATNFGVTTLVDTGMKHPPIERPADATGQSSESAMSSCPVSNVMDRRSASPVSECQTKMSLNAQGIASTSAVDEGSLVANISTTDQLPNGNLDDDR